MAIISNHMESVARIDVSVITLVRMHRVSLQEYGTAKLQGGAGTGQVATEMYNQENRAIPLGKCPR